MRRSAPTLRDQRKNRTEIGNNLGVGGIERMRWLRVNKKRIQEQTRINGQYGVEPVVVLRAGNIEFLGKFPG